MEVGNGPGLFLMKVNAIDFHRVMVVVVFTY